MCFRGLGYFSKKDRTTVRQKKVEHCRKVVVGQKDMTVSQGT